MEKTDRNGQAETDAHDERSEAEIQREGMGQRVVLKIIGTCKY